MRAYASECERAQYWRSAANASANTSQVLERLCDSRCVNVIIWLARIRYTHIYETLKRASGRMRRDFYYGNN